LKSNFTVLDVDDQIRLLKQLLQAEGIDDKRWPARMLAGMIDGWKNRGLTPSAGAGGRSARRSATARAANSTRSIRSG
jgi:DNA helicase-2/ATP-dependent DNA helicase PcrA